MKILSRRFAAVCSSACLGLWMIGAVPAQAQSLPAKPSEPVSLTPTDVLPMTSIQEGSSLQDSDDDFNTPPVNDPLEQINRVTLEFNQQLDDWLIRPAAKGYDTVVPPPVRLIIGNVFGNVGDLWTATNNLLQGKPRDAGSDALRFAINTTFGLGGIADLASDFGLPKHKEDFGQTLGRWGLPEGPYLVLPLFGPGSLRDAV